MSYKGPLHLQRFMQTADPTLETALKQAVPHEVSLIQGLFCDCKASAALRAIPPAEQVDESGDKRVEEARRRAIDQSHSKIELKHGAEAARGMQHCRVFFFKLNDETGIYHAICRRCQRVVTVYDRDLYWGTPRKSDNKPQTFPYNCGCGGHAFEVALGFYYLPDAFDENDIDLMSIAVRCATCDLTAVVFDDEAT
jgi:hypothetical protein